MIRLVVQTGSQRPIFKQIVEGIRLAVAKGEIVAGSKLPSVRALAMQLAINPNTVAKAYTELREQGLVDSRQGLGLFVNEPRQLLSDEERANRLHQSIKQCVNDVMYLGYSNEELLRSFGAELDALITIKSDKNYA
jgi:GntR family transcriptional regulator